MFCTKTRKRTSGYNHYEKWQKGYDVWSVKKKRVRGKLDYNVQFMRRKETRRKDFLKGIQCTWSKTKKNRLENNAHYSV